MDASVTVRRGTARELLSSLLRGIDARYRRAEHPHYPWWVRLVMCAAALGATVVAVGQRVDAHPAVVVAALGGLAAVPWVLGVLGWCPHWLVFTAIVLWPTAALMWLYPVSYDFAVLVLVMLAGHLACYYATTRSALGTAFAVVAVIALELNGRFDASGFAVAGIVVGWDVGFIMQQQQRALEAQERRQAAREAAVVLEERQRIAREVHDVVAHSLSVTMLHLTGARRILEEGQLPAREGKASSPEDYAEAVEALRDAERLGRQSMVDIRRTVGLLSGSGQPTAPAPGVGDIPALIQEFRDAGLDVTLNVADPAVLVPPATGLALYRIVQESLSNVARHQPHARVTVTIDLASPVGRLRVWNSLTSGTVRGGQSSGSGLRGMNERAALLGGRLEAGPHNDGWCVELSFPLTSLNPAETAHSDTPSPVGRECPLFGSRDSDPVQVGPVGEQA